MAELKLSSGQTACDGTVVEAVAAPGSRVEPHDLVIVLEAA